MDAAPRALIAGCAPERLVPALRRAGFEPAGMAQSGGEALMLLAALEPELLLAEAILPGMDGVALAEAAAGLRLRVRPAVVLVAPRGLRLPGSERLPELRSAVIAAPAEAADIAGACARIRDRWPPLPADRAARLQALLDGLGLPAHPGREALAAAIALAWLDRRRLSALRRELYPEAARRCGLAPEQAERAMRYAIDAAWRTGDMEAQNRLFGNTIDARRGRPTCGELIARLADHL